MAFDLRNFVTVENGSYSIGIPEDLAAALWERMKGSSLKREFLMNATPLHEIRPGRCHISTRLVTLGEFEDFIARTGYRTEAERDGWGWVWSRGWKKRSGVSWLKPFGNHHDERYREMRDIVPVLQASWNDFFEYCRWLSRVWGRIVEIPGEGEWEIFSRASGAPAVSGITEKDDEGETPGNDEEYFFRTVLESPDRIKTGLLWEWASDWFDSYPGGPAGRDFGMVYKVLRGGSWMSLPVQRSCEYRFRRCPTARSPFYGLRIMVRGERKE